MKNHKGHLGKIVITALFCFLSLAAFSQGKTVTGKVTSVFGESLPGVSIVIKGTTIGTITDLDGNYTIEVSSEESVLVFSFMGYITEEFAVAGVTSIDVDLEEDLMELDEIVVVGYGVQKKSDLTGAMASLGEEDFNTGVNATPEQMMQGRVAGVQITSNNGEPGAGATVSIRGSSSIVSGAGPLYVIDGVPLDMANTSPEGNAGAGGIQSTATNPLSFINANDIASIDILKDASAAAIYGSRGANGVIIITTKRGAEGKSEVSYSGTFSVSNLPKKLEVLTAEEWVDTAIGAKDDFGFGAKTDWQDEIFRQGWAQDHSLSMGGGNKTTSYRASFGYFNQEGIINNSSMERFTARMNLTQKAINDRLLIEANITGSRLTENRVPVGASGFEGDLLLAALTANPTWPTHFPDSIPGDGGKPFQTGSVSERVPTTMLAYTSDEIRTSRILSSLAATMTIVDGLNYKINVGLDYTNANRFINQSQKLDYVETNGNGEINNRELWNTLLEQTLNYNKTFGIHGIGLLAGYSYQTYNVRGNNTRAGGFLTDELVYTNSLDPNNPSHRTISSYYDPVTKMQSFFGRLNYNLMEKYLITATLRADGSSKFGENNKYGYFPSFAGAWRLSQEEFIQNLNIFNNLKLRVGWGQTGNSEIPAGRSLPTFQQDAASIAIIGSPHTTVTGLSYNATANPDIMWETTTSTNAGLDFGFFGGRLSGSFDWFSKTTTDLLIEVPVVGAPIERIYKNIDSKIINSGIELSLTGVIFATTDFTWEVTGNYAYLDNIVKDLNDVDEIRTGALTGQGMTGAYAQVITSDQPMHVFRLRVVDSISQEDGRISYKRNAADDADSLYYLGQPQPKHAWSLNNTFRYKNFDLGIFIEGKHGHHIFNNTNLLLDKQNLRQNKNSLKKYVEDDMRLTEGLRASDRYLESGSHVRLSNVTLGYTFDTENVEWLNRMRIYVAGQNLLVITPYSGYDPDVNSDRNINNVRSAGIDVSNYPKSRTFVAGINVTF